jgi:fucose permease
MFIGDKLTYHQIIAAGVTLMAMFAVLFDFSSSIFMKGFCTVGMMFGSSFIDTCINLSVMACFKGENLSNWLQAIFGCFGVGGLLVPFLVYLF